MNEELLIYAALFGGGAVIAFVSALTTPDIGWASVYALSGTALAAITCILWAMSWKEEVQSKEDDRNDSP
jgi:hypothetical protein